MTIAADPKAQAQGVFQLVASLLDALDRPMIVCDRLGHLLFANLQAQDKMNARG